VDGPFKIETKPQIIAARVTPPEVPAAGEKQARPEIWVIVVVIVFAAIVMVWLAARGKKQQSE